MERMLDVTYSHLVFTVLCFNSINQFSPIVSNNITILMSKCIYYVSVI